MKKRKVIISNRVIYTLIAFALLVGLGVGVFAYGGSSPSTMGHSAGELNLSGGVNEIAIFNNNVGIGTSSPSSKLSVGGSGSPNYGSYFNGVGLLFGVYSSSGLTSTTSLEQGSLSVFGNGPGGVYGSNSESGVVGFSPSTNPSSTGVVGVGNFGLRGYGNNIGVYSEGENYAFYAGIGGYRFSDGTSQTTSAAGSGEGVCRFCESCGGAWPNNGGNARGNTGDSQGYGASCSGSLVYLSRVQLCCK